MTTPDDTHLRPLQSGGKWNWISALPNAAFNALLSCCEYRTYKASENIYHQGDKPEALFQVISGRVLMKTYSSEGKELLYVYMEPGDCFGELGLIDGKSVHHDADAGATTNLMRLDKASFNKLRHDHPEFNEALLQLLARRTRSIYATIEDAFLLDMPHRLARRLIDLFKQKSFEASEPVLVCSHEELANMIGSTRQSISSLLKAWEHDEIISLSYGRITLVNPQKLEALMET